MPEPSESPPNYVVDRLPSVTRQILRLIQKGKLLGFGELVIDALEAIVTKLETIPLEWGDPEYATKMEGGLVLHGLYFPFVVR